MIFPRLLQQSTLSVVFLFLGFFTFCGNTFVSAQSDCDLGPDALNSLGVSIPQTCIDVPKSQGNPETSQRCFYTYVPDSCTDNDPAPKEIPLVFDIHGMGSCPYFSALYTGWREKASEECFAVVWPTGTSENFDARCFNTPGFLEMEDAEMRSTSCCCFDFWSGRNVVVEKPDDLLFLKMAIDTVVESIDTDESPLSIDTSRIYMAGHSNGCMISLAMAATHSDTVAAVCCHAGSLVTPFPEDYSPVPIWMVHGQKDETVPYEGSGRERIDVGFFSANQNIEYLSKKNGCQQAEETEVFGSDGTIAGSLSRKSDCQQDATVELLTLFEAAHNPYQFPSLFSAIFGEAPAAVDTTALAWDFCSSHVKPPTSNNEDEGPGQEDSSSPVTCTEDAKMCSDETVLVRDPENNCEFPSCPDSSVAGESSASNGQASLLVGTISLIGLVGLAF